MALTPSEIQELIKNENLSKEELTYLLKILEEVGTEGKSKVLNDIWSTDYEEIPVSIEQFISDDRYLGNSLKDAQGNLTMYPYWVNVLKKIFSPDAKYAEVALSGCLAPDTEIPLINGEVVTIQEMYLNRNKRKYQVHSYDVETDEYVVGDVTDVMFTLFNPTLKITLDNGEVIRTTYDHKFMMRDTSERKAENLVIGDELMPSKRGSTTKITRIEDGGVVDTYNITVDKYHNYALNSGIMSFNCIGSGKSTIAVVALCYTLYKLLCLKNPAGYYKLNKGSKIAIAFFNVNIEQAMGIGYTRMQNYLKASPWFMERGEVYGLRHKTYYPGKDIELIVGSNPDHFIGRDVFTGLLDELNFAKGQDASFEKSAILRLYNTIKRRIESRFMDNGQLPGMLFLVSSKNEESDFLEQYIKKNQHKSNLFIVDEPIWVVKDGVTRYGGEKFNVAVGNRYLPSRILDDNEDPDIIEQSGQRVIQVPAEYRDAFELDITTALADIAGIAIVSSYKFFNMDKVLECHKSYLVNPFRSETVVLPFEADTMLEDFLDESKLPKNRSGPHWIHWDASKNGDTTGLSMMTIADSKQVKRLVNGSVSHVTDVMPKVVFAVGIKNKPGEDIPFFKIRNFIYYLREIGFNIVSVSCDSYQSLDNLQQLKVQGFNAEMVSVDRSKQPYITLRNCINEGRLLMPPHRLLDEEFADVEEKRLKIDHTDSGCLLGDTLIATNHGDKKITDLKKSDKIYAVDIDTDQVICSSFTNLRETKKVTKYYIIETIHGQEIRCTGNHLILTARGYVRADELWDCDNAFDCDFIANANGLHCLDNERGLSFTPIMKITVVLTDEPIPVYDIEVPTYHNFTLSNGLVVHNSKDVLDTLAANVYKINQMYAPSIGSSNTAATLAQLNSITTEVNSGFDDDWIIPDGVTVYDTTLM